MDAIKKIGISKLNSIESEDKLLWVFTEDFKKTKYDRALEIRISKQGDIYTFKRINIRGYKDALKFKYLYRSGSSRGTDITPTAKLTDPKKTYPNKLVQGFKELIDYSDTTSKEESLQKEMLQSIYDVLNNNSEEILAEIEKIFNETPSKERYFILTVVVEEGDTEYYIGDFEVCKRRIKEIPIKKFYHSVTNNKDSKGEEKVCCICHNKKSEVFGLASPFAFYTIDKPGYISGGFDYENSWKNYPVCKECAIELELGKSYLDENLTLSFYGRKFYLIPNVIYDKDLDNVLKKYEREFNRGDEEEQEENRKSTKMTKKENRVESNIFKVLGQEKNNVTFDLMFIEANNNALNILLNIQDVYPSTFKKLYDGWEDIKKMKFFKDMTYLANFGYLNMLFGLKENNRYFLEMVDNIIGKGKIEYKFLIRFINSKLKESFKKEEKGEMVKGDDNYYTATMRAYTFLYYLYRMEKFKDKGGKVEKMDRKAWNIEDFGSKREAFEDFFEKNRAFFDTYSKKAVFMIGYLSKKLINLQANEEGGRTPFMSKLNGLALNKKEVLRLLPKIQGKLMEYGKEYYNEELMYASELLIDSNNLKDLANLDIPLYFSLGMNMVRKFDFRIKGEDDSIN